jgi:hypothetical protein
MGDGLISLLVAVGFAAWIYSKLMKSTNIQKNSLIGSAIAGIGGFIVLFTLLKFVLHV